MLMFVIPLLSNCSQVGNLSCNSFPEKANTFEGILLFQKFLNEDTSNNRSDPSLSIEWMNVSIRISHRKTSLTAPTHLCSQNLVDGSSPTLLLHESTNHPGWIEFSESRFMISLHHIDHQLDCTSSYGISKIPILFQKQMFIQKTPSPLGQKAYDKFLQVFNPKPPLLISANIFVPMLPTKSFLYLHLPPIKSFSATTPSVWSLSWEPYRTKNRIEVSYWALNSP